MIIFAMSIRKIVEYVSGLIQANLLQLDPPALPVWVLFCPYPIDNASRPLPLKVLNPRSLNLLNEKKDVTFSLFSRLTRLPM